MRSLVVVFWICSATVLSAQTVALRNVSFPGTSLEVGNTVEVRITGADPLGTVTVAQNGGAPFEFGTTDAFGNWSTTATETAANVGLYQQFWFVNGTTMNPSNPDPTYLPWAPALPNFVVNANTTGANGAPQSTSKAGCTPAPDLLHWIWSPVTYGNSSSIAAAIVNGAAANWNNAQARLSLSSDTTARIDILLSDDNTIGATTYGRTSAFSQDCGPCLNHTDTCNGNCLNAAAVFDVDVVLNITAMTASANAWGTTLNAVASMTVGHELGHSLRLGHPDIADGTCSEAQSLEYPDASVLFGCGILAPTSRDTTSINTVYPSVVAFCSALNNNSCVLPSPTCT